MSSNAVIGVSYNKRDADKDVNKIKQVSNLSSVNKSIMGTGASANNHSVQSQQQQSHQQQSKQQQSHQQQSKQQQSHQQQSQHLDKKKQIPNAIFSKQLVFYWDKPYQKDTAAQDLFNAAQANELQASSAELERVDVNQPWIYCRRLLHYAAQNNNPLLVEQLLKLGANASAQDADGWGVGHFAAAADAVEALEVLRAGGGNVPDCLQLRNADGDTPMLTAALFGARRAAILLARKVSSDSDELQLAIDYANGASHAGVAADLHKLQQRISKSGRRT